MAVIEIGKIQVRRGQENQTGIPQLDGGEFAWAADTEKLYIGLRRVDGGSRDDNVEILTENHLKNFFQISYTSSTYVYREGSLITAPLDDPFNEFGRSVQDKLDDIVSVKDFGVYGNGNFDVVQWDMARLQLAVDRLFLDTQTLSTATQHPRKKLYFPAGVYNFTATLYVPAYTTIIGDGVGKTIFNFTTSTVNSDSLIKTCDSTSDGGIDGYKHFDSNGGSGVDFSFTGTAKYVTIQDLTLKYDSLGTTVSSAMSLISLDCADNSVIKNVEFIGNYSSEVSSVTTSNYVAINLRGKLADGSTDNVAIDNCVFKNLHTAIKSDWDIKGTVISRNDFSNLNQGVRFNSPIEGFLGPRYVKIINNKFDLIDRQAIYVGENNATTGSFVTSQNNIFERVGLNGPWGEVSETATSVISFLSNENSSINDYFDRARVQNDSISTSSFIYYKPLVDGRTTVDNFYVSTATIFPGGTPSPLFRLPITGSSQHLSIKYSAFRPDAGQFVTTASGSVVDSFTITVTTSDGIVPGAQVTATSITSATYVVVFDTGTNEITLSAPVTVNDGDAIYLTYGIDRMGNLGLYLQDSSNPDYVLVDDYNYIDNDGGLTFSVVINPIGGYYQVNGLLAGNMTAPVIIEYQNKLML